MSHRLQSDIFTVENCRGVALLASSKIAHQSKQSAASWAKKLSPILKWIYGRNSLDSIHPALSTEQLPEKTKWELENG